MTVCNNKESQNQDGNRENQGRSEPENTTTRTLKPIDAMLSHPFQLVSILVTATFTNALLTPQVKFSQWTTASAVPPVFRHFVVAVSDDETTAKTTRHNHEFSWTNSNVYNISTFSPIPCDNGKNNPWEDFVPSPLNFNSKGCDVTIEFENSHEGAQRLAAACYAVSGATKKVVPPLMISQLEKAMDAFLGVTQELLLTEKGTTSCKARIVATRGQTGTKCPRWHLDHVPFRYIQSLVGPGCQYVVGETGLQRDVLNDLDVVDEMSIQKLNSLMVDESQADVRQAQEGQAVLLMGKAWADQKSIPRKNIGGSDGNDAPSLSACVHKSPELKPWEGRVLLTMDVVQEDLD